MPPPNGLTPQQSDALCHAVWRRGVADALAAWCEAMGLEPKAVMPEPVAAAQLTHRRLSLATVDPHAGEALEVDPERWLIRKVDWTADAATGQWIHALPGGLHPQDETPASAAQKLQALGTGLSAAAVAAGDRRQAFFLEEGLVLELLWREGLHGLECVTAVRLGSELLA